MIRNRRIKESMLQRIKTKLLVNLTIILFVGLTLSQLANNNTTYADFENEVNRKEAICFPNLSPINDSFLERPILDVSKSVNATVINPDLSEWICVNVTITNISNYTAYNLTTTDPGFEDWAVSSLNVTEQKWVIIENNASVYYFYYFKPLSEGNFTLEPTDIVYVDVNGTEYHAQSQRFIIIVIKPESIEVIDAELWLNILYYTIIISGVLGAIVLFDLFVIKRPKGTKKQKQKVVDKKGTSTQKNKKQVKRKTKKRR